MVKKDFLISPFRWHEWPPTDAVTICVATLSTTTHRDSLTPIFQGHTKVMLDIFFLIFPPFKWLAPRPNPLTQPAEGTRSSNFSGGSGWGVHVRATSASHPIRTSSFPKYEPSASTLGGGGSCSKAIGSLKMDSKLLLIYLIDTMQWHPKCFLSAKRKFHPVWHVGECSFKWHKWRKKALLPNRVNNVHDCCGTFG